MSFDDEFNAEEFRRSIERDIENAPAPLTRAEVRQLRDMLDERKTWKRIRAFGVMLGKAIVAAAVGLAAVQTGYATVMKWFAR